MPDLLLELFSEETPARMQVRAAEDLCRLVLGALISASGRGVSPPPPTRFHATKPRAVLEAQIRRRCSHLGFHPVKRPGPIGFKAEVAVVSTGAATSSAGIRIAREWRTLR